MCGYLMAEPSRQVSVSGRIVGSDAPEIGIPYASILISGYHSYSVRTDSLGQFSIPEVDPAPGYVYVASAAGYNPVTDSFSVGTSDLNLGDIMLLEPTPPPTGVQANASTGQNLALIDWQAPDRSLLGYRIWRLAASDAGNQMLWTLLTPSPIVFTNYADPNWGGLPGGIYRYAVKAVYTNNLQSEPALSNPLEKLLRGTLSGRVLDNDGFLPIEGALISASGNSCLSNSQGYYSMSIPVGVHSVFCSKPGYESVSSIDVIIINLQVTTINFRLHQSWQPAVAPQAQISGPDVVLTWLPIGSVTGDWLHYDSGFNHTSVGTGGNLDVDVAIRFPASTIAEYAGSALRAVKLWPAGAGSFSVKVWVGNNASGPGTLVYSQNFTPQLNSYNTVELNVPILITGYQDLWFGYHCQAPNGYPIGVDAGPAVNGFGNMIFFGGGWSTLLDVAPDLDHNWNIQGFVGTGFPPAAPEPEFSGLRYSPKLERNFLGYRVWRLNSGHENYETLWSSLTPAPITGTGFMDTFWSMIQDGTYRWAVKAIYSNGASEPAFSNPLVHFTQLGSITGFVRDAFLAPISGATVCCEPYTVTTSATGHYLLQAPVGTQYVKASHPDFYPQTYSGIIINLGEQISLDFQLRVPGEMFSDSFESYEDFALEFPPWVSLDLDMQQTYGIASHYWPNCFIPQAFMIFNPSAVAPPLTEMVPYEGSKLAVCAASTSAANNDWLISPQITGAHTLSFWAKSYSTAYELERIKVGISTTGTLPTDFTYISGPNYLQVPGNWTQYSYDLSPWIESPIYLVIQCLSNDAWMLMVDQIQVYGTPQQQLTQSLGLASGWSLVSFNVSPSEHDLDSITSPITGQLIMIKGRDGTYIPGSGTNSLTQLVDGQAYNVLTTEAVTWPILGDLIPSATPIPLYEGWNLAAYLPTLSLPVQPAIQSISSQLHQVKGSRGIYIPGNPYSTLGSMEPGKGYWVLLSAPDTLFYPSHLPSSYLAGAVEADGRQDEDDRLILSTSMGVLARCQTADPGDILLAWVGNELRGRETFISPEGFSACLIQIYTESDGELISFSIQKPDSTSIWLDSFVISQPHAMLGDYPQFVELDPISNLEDDVIHPIAELLGVHPNPFKDNASIRFSTTNDTDTVSFNVYNLRGQRIRSLGRNTYPKGNHTVIWNGCDDHGNKVASGIYIIEFITSKYRKCVKALLSR